MEQDMGNVTETLSNFNDFNNHIGNNVNILTDMVAQISRALAMGNGKDDMVYDKKKIESGNRILNEFKRLYEENADHEALQEERQARRDARAERIIDMEI